MSTMREAEAPLLGEQVADMTIQSRDLLAGQVVRMRRRLWRIDHVLNYEFLATPIDGRDVFSRRFLREVEVLAEGSLAIPDPNKASDPAEHDLLLRAFRLSLVHGSAPLAGLQRSRAIPTPYQLVPLLLAVGKDRVRLLIADDVGVGKTIEMGLVTSELIARGKVRRALFVVPANLREQTQEALSHFFHLDATIIAGHLRRGLERQLMPGQSVWEAHDLVVVSVDYAKRHPGEILNPSHPWDLVVFDEAHLCAQPHRPPGSRSAPDMARHDFAKKAAALIPNLMLLTATPHSGHSDSYASLLELLDADTVHWTGQNQQTPIINREAAKPHVVQRRRSDIERWFSEAGEEFPFPERDQREEVIGISSEERMVLEALRGYTDKLTAASDRVINTWVALHLQKRALSSPEALRCSIKNRIGALQRKLGDEQDSASDAEIAVTDGEGGDHDLSDEELFARVDGYALGGRDEIDELQAIKEFAAKVTVARDSKYRRLVEKVIPLALLAQKAKRVIIFTRYKDTLDYLVKNLAKDARGTRKPGRLDGIEVFEIHGQLTQPDRRARFAAFEAAQRAVLVATDCISEGMNLQRACAALVHYELPWNPNRLEQRNGRIDRFRQPEKKVTIRTLVYDDPLDVTILEALVKKAQEIRRHYGFSPPFFSSSRDLVDLMRLHGQLPSRQLDLFSTSANADPELLTQEATALSMEAAKRIESEAFYGHTTVTLDEVQRALTMTHQAVGTPQEIQSFVRAGLSRFGCAIEDLDRDRFSVHLGSRPGLDDIGDPDTRILQATFDPMVGQDDLAIEVLDLAHPLVRRLVDLVRDQGLGTMDDTQVGRVCGYASPHAEEVTALVHVLARYVTRSEPPVMMEELVPAAIRLFSDPPTLLSPTAAERLAGPDRTLGSLDPSDVIDYAAQVLGLPEFERLIADALDRRVGDLVARGQLIEEAASSWAVGMGELSLASRDILTVAVVEPPR